MPAGFLLMALGAVAAPKKVAKERWPEPVIRLPRIAVAPVVDGVVDETEWRGALRDEGYCTYRTRNVFGAESVIYLARDAENLYIASV